MLLNDIVRVYIESFDHFIIRPPSLFWITLWEYDAQRRLRQQSDNFWK
jgi:hypothetical protein